MPPTDTHDQGLMPGTAGELVAQGAAVIRIENETMMQVAVQRPRDEGAVIKGALRELELVPEEAGKAFYSIPYRERQPDGSVKIVKVEGPSVKAAMALARRWGNCVSTARMLGQDEDGFDLEGVFVDLETNFRVSRPQRVSKWFKSRRGGAELLSVDRQQMAIQAGASKGMRNAILAALPAYLVSAYDKKARAIVGGNLDAPAEKKTVDAVLKAFERWKVTPEQLEKYADRPVKDWTGTEVADLRGLWNALTDGQAQVEEVFPPERPEGQAAPSAANGGAQTLTPDSLLGGTTTGRNTEGPDADPHAAGPSDPRPAALTAILEEIGKAQPPFTERERNALVKHATGTTVIETAEIEGLETLLGLLKGWNTKDAEAVKKVRAVLQGK